MAAAAPPVMPDVQVGLAIFGSLVTEMSPPDLPEGVSPDCQDVVYYPGGVKSRPGLRKRLQFNLNTTLTWSYTWLMPNGQNVNIYLTSDGILWRESIDVTPGVYTQIGQIIPGSYCNAVSAFGRLYMAFFNGITPTDLPLQYDGTNLDRVSQYGPGAPPVVGDVGPPALQITNWSQPQVPWSILSIAQNGTQVTVVINGIHDLFVGDEVVIETGNIVYDNYNLPIRVEGVPTNSSFTYTVGVAGLPGLAAGTVQALIYEVVTAAPHGLFVGDQFTISGTTILDNNHNFVETRPVLNIAAIFQEPAGTNVVTVVIDTVNHPNQAYSVASGTQFTVTGTSNNIYEQFGAVQTVSNVLSANSFTYIVPQTGAPYIGTGQINPKVNVSNPATWTVRTVLSPTTFTFTAVFPNVYGTSGTLYPGGASAEGAHKVVVMFQTRNGYITPASTPAVFTSAGGRKFNVTSIPIGPPNVVARILAFTGAGGTKFFYVPVPPMGTDITGNRVPLGTSTIVNDNTSTSAVINIADNSLFASLGIDIPGNDLFSIRPLGPSIGCFYYAMRMFWWGARNNVPNFQNLDFNGGYNTPNVPLGWSLYSGSGGSLIPSTRAQGGMMWQADSGVRAISQPAYQDFYGVDIIRPNTTYTFEAWVQIHNVPANQPVEVVVTLTGPGLTLSTSVAINPSITGWQHVQVAIGPTSSNASSFAGLQLVLWVNGLTGSQTVDIDEVNFIVASDPQGLQFNVSYVANPESFDDVTGRMGADDDPTPIMTTFEHHDLLHFLTMQGLHSSRDIVSSEPSQWSIVTVSKRCGAASPRAMDVGENFAVWVSAPLSNPPTPRGMYVYFGGDCYKISQENQPIFDTITGNTQQSIWVKNDLDNRRILAGLPISGATAPNLIYPLDYRELDTANDIASRPPIHISFTGKMICSDLSRKSTRWNIPANYAAMMKQPGGSVIMSICGGNGQAPGAGGPAPSPIVTPFDIAPRSVTSAGLYVLDEAKMTDDDYGVIVPYYTTYMFVNHEMEVALQVGLGRKLYKGYSAYISGVGLMQITPIPLNLKNPWPVPVPVQGLFHVPTYDMGDSLNISAERCAFKIASVPYFNGTDNSFDLQKFIIDFRKEPVSPTRFGAI